MIFENLQKSIREKLKKKKHCANSEILWKIRQNLVYWTKTLKPDSVLLIWKKHHELQRKLRKKSLNIKNLIRQNLLEWLKICYLNSFTNVKKSPRDSIENR